MFQRCREDKCIISISCASYVLKRNSSLLEKSSRTGWIMVHAHAEWSSALLNAPQQAVRCLSPNHVSRSLVCLLRSSRVVRVLQATPVSLCGGYAWLVTGEHACGAPAANIFKGRPGLGVETSDVLSAACHASTVPLLRFAVIDGISGSKGIYREKRGFRLVAR